MSDPVLISQIITSLGLSGQEAEAKRQELEKLTNDELNKLIANISSYSPAELGGFSALSHQEKFSGNVFKPAIIDDLQIAFPSSASSSSAYAKEYSSLQRKELDRFLGDFLFNSASSGYQELKAYNDSVGWFNITDRVVNGFKVLTGQQDRIGLQQQMSEEMQTAKKLKDAAYSQPAAFESQFERKYGVPYSHANVENLKQASETYTRATAYHEKTQLLKDGFKEIKNILQQEQEYANARKYVRGAAAASLQPPEVSSHEKFGEVLLQFCNGDQNLVNEYMKTLSAKMGSKSEIEKNLPKIMEELIQKAEAQEKEALGNKTYSQYQQEYETACKKVFGTKDYKETAKNFVENAKTQAAYTEIGITIAASMLLPSSSIARKGIQKAALKYGEKASMNMMKGAMTVTTGSLPAALTTLNAATSEAGFTPEAIAQIKEKFKSGMLYGGYGAFVSSPLGLAVEKVLSKNPTMLSNIVSKTMGAATETSADVLLDRMTSDLSFIDSLKQNGIMNFGMMIAGGQINRALSKLTVSKTDNGYTVKDETGKEVFNAEDENALAGFVMAKAAENTTPSDAAVVKSDNAAEANPFQTKNTAQTSDPVLPKAAELPFSELKAQVEEKLNNVPGLKEEVRYTPLNEENIVVLNKILSDEKLYTNPNVIIYNLNNLLYNIKRPEQQQFALKLLSDERIYNNKEIMDKSVLILQSCTDAQSVKGKIDVIDFLLSNEKCLNIAENIKNLFTDLMYVTSNSNQVSMLKKLLSDERLHNNPAFLNEIPNIIYLSKSPEDAAAKMTLFDKVMSDEKLYTNTELMNQFGRVLSDLKTDTLPLKIRVIDKFLSDDKLYNNTYVKNDLFLLLRYANTPEQLRLAETILSDEKLFNNPAVTKDISILLNCTESGNILIVKEALADIASAQPKRSTENNIQMIMDSHYTAMETVADWEQYRRVIQEALSKKDQLKAANQDLSNQDIENFFESNRQTVSYALKMLGEDTFTAAFNLKLEGLKELCDKCDDIKYYLSADDYKALTEKIAPPSQSRIKQLQDEITALKKQFPAAKASGDPQAFNDLKNKINTKTKELRDYQNSGAKLDPQTKINKLRVIASLSRSDDISKFIDLIQTPTKESEQAWNKAIEEKVFESLGFEYDKQLADKLNIVNNKYLGEILSGDEDFKDGFRDILTLLKEHPDMSVKQVLDTLPQNVDTKMVLENYGINYDRWTQADKDSYIAVQIHSKADETRQNAITSLEAEFNNIAFTNLPAEYTQGIITRLNEQGIVLKDVQETVFDGDGVSVGTRTVKRLYVNDKPIEFSQMKKVMDIIKEEMNKDIWTKQSSDPTVENYRSTMYTHLMKDRRTQIRQAGEIKDDKVSNLEIRQTDMNDINHALFLGNHGSCCTAVGTGCNQFSAPTYIKNKLVSAIEVVDGNNFVGNTMCYFANVDGQPALILDNIELKGQYQFNDKIRDAMFDYAKQLCTEIGQPNLPIYAGPFRHKLNMEHLDKQPHTLQVLGSTGSDEIYLDFITSGRQVNGQRIDNDIMLYKIR